MHHPKCPPFNRTSIRRREYDYTIAASYFLTICANKMRCIFGRVLAESVALSSLGLLVRSSWCELPKHFPSVELDELIVMPNHLHAILTNRTDAARGNQENVEGFANPVSGSLPTIIRSFKSAVTKRARERDLWGEGPLWQRGYYEHVIRTGESLKEIRWYIQQNPNRWRSNRLP